MKKIIKNLIKEEEINMDLIREMYPSLKLWANSRARIIYNRIFEEQLIREFLYTVSADKTIQTLKNQFGNDIKVDYERNSKKIITTIFIVFKGKETLNKLITLLDKFGWYTSMISDNQIEGSFEKTKDKIDYNNFAQIQCEKKFDEEVNLTKYKYLYHLTPSTNLSNISISGLSPKSAGKLSNHPERIYLFYNLTNDMIDDLAKSLYKNNTKKEYIESMFLLRIDLDKIREHKFFDDPSFPEGKAVWTYENIPPNALKKIKDIKVK